MIFGTKIKWFSHLNKNAPLLANEWGSFINLLDACLVNGYSEQQVTNISIVGNTLVLKYPQVHQYQQYQVVTITGANNAVLNGPHRITEVSSDGLSMRIEYESLVGIVETSLILTTKITPLGWEKIDSGTNKAVYKFIKDSGVPAYLFVDDTFPGDPYTTTWAKFARVGVSEDYLGNFTPLGATIPQNWDNFAVSKTASSLFLGTCKWFYAANSDSLFTSRNNNVVANGNRSWYISGDSSYIYFLNDLYPGDSGYVVYSAGEYDCIHQNFKNNVYLNSTDYRLNLLSDILPNFSSNQNLIANNASNVSLNILKSYISESAKPSYLTSYPGISVSGYSNVLSKAGPINFFRTNLISESILHGSLKSLYWLGVSEPFLNLQTIVKTKSIYKAFTSYADSYKGQFLLKIGSEE